MPGAGGQDNVPRFEAHEELRASKLNQLGDVLRRQSLVPGQFQSGSLNVVRPVARAGAGEAGPPGASGTFLVELSSSIDAGSAGSMASGTGTVYSISGPGGDTTSEGSRTVYNPFPSALPASAGGATAVYPCAKTYEDEYDDANDEFTITGIDVLRLLASKDGFGTEKSLVGAASAEDIEWEGAPCVNGNGS